MKALVLAGGLPQVALLEDLKRRGITTVLADWFPNPVAKPYADIFYQVSTLDLDAITWVAKDEKVDFLITVCTDQALLTVAKVSEDLGLPCYVDYRTALNVTNKSYMKRVFAETGVSTAKFRIMGSLNLEEVEELRYPLIVKPVDCNSSKGVRRVDGAEELAEAFAEAVRLSRTVTAVVEEFIDGPELSVDVYVEEGVAHLLSVSQLDKIPEKDKFIIFRSKRPESLSDALLEQIRQTAQQIADGFGLKNSPMLIQMISDGSRAYVLEFSARTGGGEKFRMIQRVSGVDVISAVTDLTLGKIPSVKPSDFRETYFASEFIYCRPGVFDRIEGAEELLEKGVLCDFYGFRSKGTRFDGIHSSGDRVAGYSMIASSREELEEKHRIAVAALRVLDETGEDMMRRDLLPDLY